MGIMSEFPRLRVQDAGVVLNAGQAAGFMGEGYRLRPIGREPVVQLLLRQNPDQVRALRSIMYQSGQNVPVIGPYRPPS